MHACEQKLEKLLRFHRQNVFDEETGDAHARAIRRLKRTITARTMANDRRERESIRKGEMLARMGY